MIRRLEASGCWLWDNFRFLVVVVLICHVAVALVMNDWGPYARRAPLGVLLAVMVIGWRWGLWADEQRRARRCSNRQLVIDLGPEDHAELCGVARRLGCSLAEFVKRGVVLYRLIAGHRDASEPARVWEIVVRDPTKGWVTDSLEVDELALGELAAGIQVADEVRSVSPPPLERIG